MDLGLPWWIGAGEPDEGIQRAREAGYDFLELSLDAPWPDGLDPAGLAERVTDAGLGLGLHAPWRSQGLAHPREPLAQAAREVAQSCVTAAREAGADYLVFHADAGAFSRYPRQEVVRDGLETAHASLRALSRAAGDELSILVENTASPLGTVNELAAFLEPLPDVGFCLDPGHAAIEARRGDETWTPDDWVEALGDRLELVHLMDLAETPTGIEDHLLPGEGEADLAAIADAARGAGCSRLLLEAFRTADGETPDAGDWRRAREHVASL